MLSINVGYYGLQLEQVEFGLWNVAKLKKTPFERPLEAIGKKTATFSP